MKLVWQPFRLQGEFYRPDAFVKPKGPPPSRYTIICLQREMVILTLNALKNIIGAEGLIAQGVRAYKSNFFRL